MKKFTFFSSQTKQWNSPNFNCVWRNLILVTFSIQSTHSGVRLSTCLPLRLFVILLSVRPLHWIRFLRKTIYVELNHLTLIYVSFPVVLDNRSDRTTKLSFRNLFEVISIFLIFFQISSFHYRFCWIWNVRTSKKTISIQIDGWINEFCNPGKIRFSLLSF